MSDQRAKKLEKVKKLETEAKRIREELRISEKFYVVNERELDKLRESYCNLGFLNGNGLGSTKEAEAAISVADAAVISRPVPDWATAYQGKTGVWTVRVEEIKR